MDLYGLVDWAAVATISTRREIQTFPTANLVSLSDGPIGNGTGVPYMYLTPLDYTAQDIAVSRHHALSAMYTLYYTI